MGQVVPDLGHAPSARQPLLESPDDYWGGSAILGYLRARPSAKDKRHLVLDRELKLLRQLCNEWPFAFFVVDRSGEIRYSNDRFESICGRDWLSRVQPEARSSAHSEWLASIRAERPFAVDVPLIASRGMPSVWIHFACSPQMDPAGTLVGFFGTAEDVTARRRADLDKDGLRNELLKTITRDLKAPIASIKGSVAMALEANGIGDPRLREMLELVGLETSSMARIVDSIADVGYLDASSLTVSPEPCDLWNMMVEVRARLSGHAGHREVHVEAANELPTVNVDRPRIVQMMTVLLDFAVSISPSVSSLHLAVRTGGHWATVQVRFNNVGREAAEWHRIFKKFADVEERCEQEAADTGFGLAVCKGVIEAHGGRILANRDGDSLLVTFTLPVFEGGGMGILPLPASAAGSGKRVMIIDADGQTLCYLQRCLESDGFRTVGCTDGAHAPDLVQGSGPDLVIMDVDTRDEALVTLSNLRRVSPVPIVVIGDNLGERGVADVLNAGADDFLGKPLSGSEMCARIRAVLRRSVNGASVELEAPIVLGDLAIDLAERRVTIGGKLVALTRHEFMLLSELAIHAGRVLTYGQLLKKIWGQDYSSETDLVRSCVRHLRRKMGDNARDPRYIFTEPQVGYRLVGR